MILQVPKRDFSLRESELTLKIYCHLQLRGGVGWGRNTTTGEEKDGVGGGSESISSQSPLLWQPVVEKQFAIKKKKN